MNTGRGNKKLIIFTILALFLGLQICLVSYIPAAAADPAGWFDQYTNDSEGIYGVSAVSSTVCWAVGQRKTASGTQQIVMKTTNGGSSWTTYYPNTTNKLTCISGVDSNVCWVGGMGIILKTTNGGSSWTTIYTNSDRAIMDISAVSSTTCWAVGCNPNTTLDGFVLKSNFLGTGMVDQLFGLLYPVMGVSAVNSLTCWAVGGTYNVLTGEAIGTVWKTDLGGIPWIPYESSNSAYWDVSAVSSLVAWVNGVSFSTSPIELKSLCFLTTSGGLTWSSAPSPTLPIPFYHGLQAIDANSAWQATMGPLTLPGFYTGSIYKTTNGGGNWNLQACAASDRQLAGLDGINSSTAWAVGSDLFNPLEPSKGIIMHTTDGGNPPLPQISSINPTSGNMGSEVTITGTGLGPNDRMSKVTFADKQASIVSWSDTQIKCKVPLGLSPGAVTVKATTLGGTSSGVSFTVNPPSPIVVNSIVPDQESQFALFQVLTITGSGFQAGAQVKLEKLPSIIYADSESVVSSTEMTCRVFFFGYEPGVYDVVVTNPDGGEGRLDDSFTVTPLCGTGSGSALLLLGLTLGLLSLAGSGGYLRKRRARKVA